MVEVPVTPTRRRCRRTDADSYLSSQIFLRFTLIFKA
nr:MAG TPA: hypothetical protein [Caudoviricetes sp.]